MTRRRYQTTLVRDGVACFVPVPFDPKPVFGKVRAPVKVTLRGYTYRSTIAAMGGVVCVPLRKSHREAAELEGNETLTVSLELDTDEREVVVPPELQRALSASPAAWERWSELSYTHRREHVDAIDGAKKPETRTRRIAAVVQELQRPAPAKPRPAKKAAKRAAEKVKPP